MSDRDPSTRLWFFRGVAGGIMLFAAANALSWFYLSDGWSDLLGTTQNSVTEAVGFPFEIWREGNTYGRGWIIDFPAAATNLLIGCIFFCLCGWIAIKNSSRLKPLLMMPPQIKHRRKNHRSTFSLRGLIMMTTIAAIFLAAIQALGATPKMLTAIYLAGPFVLILIAMAPVDMPWKHRVVVLVLFAVVLLSGSVYVGSQLGMEFDRVLMGVYICWVPQSVIATVIVLLWTGATQKLSTTEPVT